MAEYGSGWRAKPHFNDARGGQGTFPGQTHAFDSEVGIGETKAENYIIHTALHLQCYVSRIFKMENDIMRTARKNFS
jgi:hypothetical protein